MYIWISKDIQHIPLFHDRHTYIHTYGYDGSYSSSQWRHYERDGVSNHRRLDNLLNRLFRRRSKKTSKLRVTGLCKGRRHHDALRYNITGWNLSWPTLPRLGNAICSERDKRSQFLHCGSQWLYYRSLWFKPTPILRQDLRIWGQYYWQVCVYPAGTHVLPKTPPRQRFQDVSKTLTQKTSIRPKM